MGSLLLNVGPIVSIKIHYWVELIHKGIKKSGVNFNFAISIKIKLRV